MDKTVLYYEQPAKTAKLSVFNPATGIAEYVLTAACSIGRKVEGSRVNLQIDSPVVSREHGEIAVMEGEYFYRDLGSLNGTFVNGRLYGKGSRIPAVKLENGDILRIDAGAGKHQQSTVMIFATAYSEQASWQTQNLDVNVAEVNIGRATSGGLKMDNQMVSKNHATFFRWEQGWAIADHDSSNGVFVNNRRISKSIALQPMDVVRIVDSHFIFTGDSLLFQYEPPAAVPVQPAWPQPAAHAAPSGSSLFIRITERSVWQRFKKLTLLQNINLVINSSEMVLILGGSGAGKTTFMNAVMGYEKADGQIFHGGTDIYNEYDKMKYEIGFVQQQDPLRGSDVVYNTLSDAADSKMPIHIPRAQKNARIEEVLALLGLQRERNSLVSKLSGGQRKRLSIAVELIADPSLFFLDEPDSGLDGIMARSLNKQLRAIADSGKIVMVITHSPDRVADLYDKVIVLAKSTVDNCGRLAFFGSIPEAHAFFDTNSLEGVVKRINRQDEGGDGQSDHYINKYEWMMGGQ